MIKNANLLLLLMLKKGSFSVPLDFGVISQAVDQGDNASVVGKHRAHSTKTLLVAMTVFFALVSADDEFEQQVRVKIWTTESPLHQLTTNRRFGFLIWRFVAAGP